MSKAWQRRYKRTSTARVHMLCEFCGAYFSEKGSSKVLCKCGKDHAICYECVVKYAETRKIDKFRWHSVKICPGKELRVALALMEDRAPSAKKLKW